MQRIGDRAGSRRSLGATGGLAGPLTRAIRVAARLALVGVLVVPLGGSSVSAQAGAEPTTAGATNRGASALLYRVRDGGRTLYLAGSIHLLRESDYPLAAAYEEAYRDSGEIVLEILNSDQDSGEAQRAMMGKGMLPEGEFLRDTISSEHYEVLRQHVRKNGLDVEVFDRMRPWLAAMTLAVLEYSKLGALPEHGMDRHFERRARRDGKPAFALETIEQQLGLLSGLSDTESREMLEQTLDEIEDLEGAARRLMNAWKAGDARRLEKLILKDAGRYPGLMEKLLFERNARWMEPLEKLLGGDRNVMVIVGAGHLVGEKGLVQMLEAEGYDVEKVEAPERDGDLATEPVR